MATTMKWASVEDFDVLGSSNRSHEVIRSELVEVPPAGFDRGDVAVSVGTELRRYATETGYVLSEHHAEMPGISVAILELFAWIIRRHGNLPRHPYIN